MIREYLNVNIVVAPMSIQKEWRPIRGSVVKFQDRLYFHQPRGNHCWLFDNRRDVGIKERVVASPGRLTITRPTPTELEAFLELKKEVYFPVRPPVHPIVPLTEFELELLERKGIVRR